MDKPAIDQSKEEPQTPKSSGASSTVLSILKRFRTRREDTAEPEAPFVERLGAANGPLAERISEISSRIEAGRAQVSAAKQPQSSDPEDDIDAAPDADGPSKADETLPGTADAETLKSESRPTPRVRAMGFHNPVFPAKSPDEPKDPDFVASTEPPVLRLHDAPDGVMENPGAPEKRLTGPRERATEPLDLRAFAEQVRSKLPKPEPEPQSEDHEEGAAAEVETESDAAAFKQQFYTRISKASNALAFEAFPFHQEPTVLPVPSNTTDSKSGTFTASSTLQSWRQIQPAREQPAAETPLQPMQETRDATDAPAQEWSPKPAENEVSGSDMADSLGDIGLHTPDEATDLVAEGQDDADYSEYEPHFDDGSYEEEQDEAAGAYPEDLPEPVEEPETEPTEDPEPENLTEFEPVAADMPSDEGQETQQESEGASEAPPENVFAALDIDEDEILVKVYDLIQAELQAAWGENITLNIRRIVRDEVQAAIEKARSEN